MLELCYTTACPGCPVTRAAADIIALAGDGCDTAARPDPCRSVLPSVLYLATSWCKPAECIPHVPHTIQHEQNVPCHFVANVLATWDCIQMSPQAAQSTPDKSSSANRLGLADPYVQNQIAGLASLLAKAGLCSTGSICLSLSTSGQAALPACSTETSQKTVQQYCTICTMQYTSCISSQTADEFSKGHTANATGAKLGHYQAANAIIHHHHPITSTTTSSSCCACRRSVLSGACWPWVPAHCALPEKFPP